MFKLLFILFIVKLYACNDILKLPPQKYEHKQDKILTDKHKSEGFNKTSKKQPCPTINNKMTINF